jgi:Flp pilus assembly protein TadD
VSTAQSTHPWIRQLLPALLLLAATLVAYSPTILHGGFVWDDDFHVIISPVLRDLAGLGRIWIDPTSIPQYYPLVHSTFWIEYQLWGLTPRGYHVVNVLLHALNAVLLWRVLLRLGLGGAASLFAACTFALHPVHVESVAWITERKNVLSAAFYLFALLSSLRWLGLDERERACQVSTSGKAGRVKAPRAVRLPDKPEEVRIRWRWYLLSLLLYVAALLSKSVTCSLPAALLLIVWWKRGRMGWGDVWPLLPMFALGFAAAINTTLLERHHVGATGEPYDLSWVDRCLIAGRALWFYAGKLVWPVDLAFIYERWVVDPRQWWQWLYPVGVIAVVAAFWLMRRRITRGPLTAVLFFAGTLVPALGFIDVFPMRYSFVADHFQYLASAGLIALFAAMWMRWLGGLPDTGQRRVQRVMGRVAAPAAILFLLGALTWQQCWIYQDRVVLWQDTAEKNRTGWLPFHNLGFALEQQGKSNQAIDAYRHAIRNDPGAGDTFLELGALLVKQGELAAAAVELRKAVELVPHHPIGHTVLGGIAELQGSVEDALAHYRIALEHKPQYTPARLNLAHGLLKSGRRDEALKEFDESLRQERGMSPALRLRVADGYRVAGAIPQATEQYAQVAREQPDNFTAVQMWGLSLATLGRFEEAIPVLRRALEMSPSDAAATNALIHIYERTGRIDNAEALRGRISAP